MKRKQNASLKSLNSFSIEARAGQLFELESEEDIQACFSEHPFDRDNDLLLGGGSNILLARDIKGTVILNRVYGREIISESDDEVLLEARAGENWHQLVLWSLDQGLSGIENLSLIPGLAGAAPMQNIGAYGVELADVLDSVLAVELSTGKLLEFKHDQCKFAYRDSRFKSVDDGKYLITAIRLRLQRKFIPRLGYTGISDELETMGVTQATAKLVSDAVIRIRKRKLPNPAQIANAGSFFRNPVVDRATAESLAADFNGLQHYPAGNDQTKLSAAWMIDQCGWKGYRRGGAGVSEQHALVLVNYGNATGREILDLANSIRTSVAKRFGIELIPEPRIIE